MKSSNQQTAQRTKLNSVKVLFQNSAHNYETSVSAETTEQSAKDYFVGQSFNVGKYPSEMFRKCIGVEFTDNNSTPQTEVQTIDINVKEWFDKANGNSYFAGSATVNFGTETEQTVELPFQYGYGDHYKYQGFVSLEKAGLLTDLQHYDNGSTEAPFRYCERKRIVLRYSKQENCKKRDLK